jgi:DNA polymerase-1
VHGPLLLVDGDNLAHRAYHSTPKSIEDNAIRGFFGMLDKLIAREQPGAVFVAFDTLGVDTYRHRLWPPYQTGRVFDPAIVEQLNRLPDLCRSAGHEIGKAAGFEADDLIATRVARSEGPCLIYTSDKDAYQLVSDRVTVLAPRPGGREPERIGEAEVVAKLGVLPAQVPDFKALAGDPSDKIPGLKGIGPKTAANLLLAHGTLDAVMETLRPEDAALVRTFRQITTMRQDAPL